MEDLQFTKEELSTAAKVAKILAGGERYKRDRKVDQIPTVDELFDDAGEVNRAVDILVRGIAVKEEIARLQDGCAGDPGLAQYKELATAICVGRGADGFRYGSMAVLVRTQTRNTFDKERLVMELLDAGVEADTIERAMKAANVTGDPYYVVDFRKI